MCNRLTKLSITMWYTFFGIFDDTSQWILPKTHDPSLCDTPNDMKSHENPLYANFVYFESETTIILIVQD